MSLERVSVRRVGRREDARAYIAFKHIKGVAKWDTYARATFAAGRFRSMDGSVADVEAGVEDHQG